MHSANLPEQITRDMPPPIHYRNEDRMHAPAFPFPPLMMHQPHVNSPENGPTDLRIVAPKSNCPYAPPTDEPENLAFKPRPPPPSDVSDNDSDAEIDLTSHSSKDDDLRDSERLASKMATSIFSRTDAVLHDLVPNDLSLGAAKSLNNPRNSVSM